jgi:hypothetical protein
MGFENDGTDDRKADGVRRDAGKAARLLRRRRPSLLAG